jgi:tetratricopeptide (TPR) repeat protein
MSKLEAKKLVFLVYLVLAAAVVVCFWQVRNFDFINYDDNNYVYENQHVLTGLTGSNMVWAFTTGHTGYWHPLTWLSFMLDCQLFGPNPGLIHLVSLLLHVANTLLLFAVLKKMTASLWPSAFVAAAFALHPMHIESVAWIAERKDVLSTFFWILTLAAYVGYVRRRGLFRYLLAILLFAFGLMAKPMVVTLPFILLLLDYWPLNRFAPQIIETAARPIHKSVSASDRRAVLHRVIVEKIPFFALSAVLSVATFLVQWSMGIAPDINVLPLHSRVANAFLSYAKYICKMFWPQNLAIIYPLNADAIQFWPAVLCALLLIGISLFALYFGRKQKYLLVGWFWFVVTLIPVIGLIQSGAQALADRYTYIPYIGLFIMIAWGVPALVSRMPYRKIVLGLSAVIVLTALGICTRLQASYWNNSANLFTHAIEVTQNNYIAQNYLAHYWRAQGNIALAVEHYKESLQIKPIYVSALLGLGCALGDQGNSNQAIAYFQKALQLKPDSAEAHDNLGVALRKQGKLDEAIAQFEQAVCIKPDLADCRNSFAKTLIMKGRLDDAIDQFRAAVRLKPDWYAPMNDLAWYIATHPEIKNRDVNEAIRLATRACELTNYKSPAIVGTLAAAYASAGRFPEAINTAKTALALARAANLLKIENIIQYHLTFYEQGKPYVEPPAKPAAAPEP